MLSTTKSIKKTLLIKTLFFTLLLFATAIQAYISQVDILVNEETGQVVICLGDFHLYPAHWKNDPEKKIIAREQQKIIIKFAKECNATLLIEPLLDENPLIRNTPKEKEKQLFKKVLEKKADVKIESTLAFLYLHCILNNILCKNIDCRTSAECFDPITGFSRLMKPQEIVDLAQETAKRIAQFNDKKPFRNIYQKELDNFAIIFPRFKKLVEKLGDHSNTPLDKLMEQIRDGSVTFTNDTLDAFEDFYNIVFSLDITIANDIVKLINYIIDISHKMMNSRNITDQSHFQPNEILDLIWEMVAFPIQFVDMHILHEIAQEKQKPIVVVSGLIHTKHVVKRLQQCGYTLRRSIGKINNFLTLGSKIPEYTFPSALDLETIFNNLEPTKGEYYVQKVKNFFQHPWTKRIAFFTYFSTVLVSGNTAKGWLRHPWEKKISLLTYYSVLIAGNKILSPWLLN